MPMTCSHCRRQFHEGDKVQYTGLSVYHELPKPGYQDFQYAIEKPFCCTSIRHLVCNDYGD